MKKLLKHKKKTKKKKRHIFQSHKYPYKYFIVEKFNLDSIDAAGIAFR